MGRNDRARAGFPAIHLVWQYKVMPAGRFSVTSRNLLEQAGFEPVQCLGRGGLGDIWEVTHPDMERPWAVRILPLSYRRRGADPQIQSDVERRLEVLSTLEHSHLVRIHDFGFVDGSCWIRTDLAPGDGRGSVTLADLAERSGGIIEPELLIELMSGVLAGVACIHAHGLVHGCLKPSNIMLYRLPDKRLVARVADAGLAFLQGDNLLRRKVRSAVQASVEKRTPDDHRGDAVRRLVATWQYWSPEQQAGKTPDARSDVFSLGLICYRLITGRKLSPRPPSYYNRELSSEYDSFILTSLDSDPSRRHADAGRMRDALEPARKLVIRHIRERRAEETGRRVAECRARASDLAAQGMYDNALAELQQMMEECPGRPDLVEDYSAIEDRRHRDMEARRIEEDYFWELKEAENLEKAGDIDGAAAIWRNLHNLCPDKPEPLSRLAVLEERIRIRNEATLKDDLATAREEVEQAESADPVRDRMNATVAEYRRLRSEVWDAVEEGRFSRAMELLKDVRERFRDSTSLQNEIDLIEEETLEARANARRSLLMHWLMVSGGVLLVAMLAGVAYFALQR